MLPEMRCFRARATKETKSLMLLCRGDSSKPLKLYLLLNSWRIRGTRSCAFAKSIIKNPRPAGATKPERARGCTSRVLNRSPDGRGLGGGYPQAQRPFFLTFLLANLGGWRGAVAMTGVVRSSLMQRDRPSGTPILDRLPLASALGI